MSYLRGYDRSFKKFAQYAFKNGIHDGQATIHALEQLYDEHKGSHYKTIVDLFKANYSIMFLKEYYDDVV